MMTVDHVCQLLRVEGFVEQEPLARKFNVNGLKLVTLTRKEMRDELGLAKQCHRERLSRIINLLVRHTETKYATDYNGIINAIRPAESPFSILLSPAYQSDTPAAFKTFQSRPLPSSTPWTPLSESSSRPATNTYQTHSSSSTWAVPPQPAAPKPPAPAVPAATPAPQAMKISLNPPRLSTEQDTPAAVAAPVAVLRQQGTSPSILRISVSGQSASMAFPSAVSQPLGQPRPSPPSAAPIATQARVTMLANPPVPSPSSSSGNNRVVLPFKLPIPPKKP